MSSPGETEISLFARLLFTDQVLIQRPVHTINTMVNFKDFLISKKFPAIISAEFAERNLGNVIVKIFERCEEWSELGLKNPLHILDQKGRLITWLHPRFEEISGKKPLSPDYCSILKSIQAADSREFLGYCACYLYALGCTKIFITDSSGDGGIDLVGSFSDGMLRNVCIFVQAKTTASPSQLSKEVLLADYSKFLLLRKMPKWSEYSKAMGADSSISGMGSIFIFLSNSEFKPGLRDAAVGLEILLRSGRQAAGALAEIGGPTRINRVVDALRPFEASSSKNLFPVIQRNL